MKAAAIVLAVFVLGAVTGGAVIHATRPPALAAPRPPERLSPPERADLLTRRLGLTPAQRDHVVEALRAHLARLRAARAQLHGAIREVLDDDQRARFDDLIGGPPGPPPP